MTIEISEKPTTIDDVSKSMEPVTILSLDDEDLCHDTLRLLFETPLPEGPVELLTAKTPNEAFEILKNRQIHLVLLDVDLGKDSFGNDLCGINFIPEIKDFDATLQIVMMTGSHDLQHCAQAMKMGALNYMTKDLKNEVIRAHISKALHVSKLERAKIRSARLQNPVYNELAGRSQAMRRVRRDIRSLAETTRPILLMGEPGSGKTLSAKLIHDQRKIFLKQNDRPFFAVNIAELGRERAENELFGHERGAYTGADQMKEGYFELANGGTLFLDEIGEASLELQAKLLRVIDEKKFRRLGSGTERTSNFHLICATNRPLEAMVESGEFREDLYMRISTFILQLPTLAERQEDIPELIKVLLRKACVDNSVFVEYEDLPKDFIEYLKDVPFKGNVRGLEQQISRLLLFTPRTPEGKPELHRWRDVPGIALKRSSRIIKESPKSMIEFISQNIDFKAPDFPGLYPFLDHLSDKLFQSAFAHFDSSAQVARVFRMAESTVSLRRKHLGLQKVRGKLNPEGTPA